MSIAKNGPNAMQESRRGSAISLLFSGRKKKWPSLFGGKKRGRPDGDSYASEAFSDVRMKDLEQVYF